MNDLSAGARANSVRALWDWITGARSTRVAASRRVASASELRGVRTTMREMLEGLGGEASARRRVAALAHDALSGKGGGGWRGRFHESRPPLERRHRAAGGAA